MYLNRCKVSMSSFSKFCLNYIGSKRNSRTGELLAVSVFFELIGRLSMISGSSLIIVGLRADIGMTNFSFSEDCPFDILLSNAGLMLSLMLVNS